MVDPLSTFADEEGNVKYPQVYDAKEVKKLLDETGRILSDMVDKEYSEADLEDIENRIKEYKVLTGENREQYMECLQKTKLLHIQHRHNKEIANRISEYTGAGLVDMNVFNALAIVSDNEDTEYLSQAMGIFQRYKEAGALRDLCKKINQDNYKEILDILNEDKVFTALDQDNIDKTNHRFNILSIADKDLVDRTIELIDYENIDSIFSQITSDKEIYIRTLKICEKHKGNQYIYSAIQDVVNQALNIDPVLRIYEKYEGEELLSLAQAIAMNCLYSAEQADFFCSEQVEDLFKIYEPHVISRALGIIAEGRLKQVSLLEDPRVAARINRNGSLAIHYGRIQEKIRIYTTKIGDCLERRSEYIHLFSNATKTIGNVEYVIEALDKYIDEFEDFDTFISELDGQCYFQELLSDDCYQKVSASKNPYEYMKKIVAKDYHDLRVNMDEGEILSYKDLDSVFETWQLVEEVHISREYEDLEKIEDGFYAELNRAMSQGSNDGQKRRNLKQYCREVRNKIRDNAADLMVMHDE